MWPSLGPFREPPTRATTFSTQSPRVSGAAAPAARTGCGVTGRRLLRCLRGDSSVRTPALLPDPGGGKPTILPSSSFPVFSASSALAPPSHSLFPQIYSSTLGELGRHPASPTGVATVTTRRSREGSGRSRPFEAGDWARITSFSTPTPTRCCGDPDTDCPRLISIFPPSFGRPETASKGRRPSELVKEGKAPALGDGGRVAAPGGLQSRWRRGRGLRFRAHGGSSQPQRGVFRQAQDTGLILPSWRTGSATYFSRPRVHQTETFPFDWGNPAYLI